MKKIYTLPIKLYRDFLSFSVVYLFGRSCRFTPTCSEYAVLSIDKYGIIKGSYLSFKRILRCNPLVRGGYDPVG